MIISINNSFNVIFTKIQKKIINDKCYEKSNFRNYKAIFEFVNDS